MRAGVIAGILAAAIAAPVIAQQGQGQGQGTGTAGSGTAAQQARARRADMVLERLDKDHDGVVSASEWPRGEQAFARLDVNKDGVLSQDELGRAPTPRQRLVQRLRANRVRLQLRRMDVNHDGLIARDEWRGKAELFDRMDADKSGTLSAAEIRQFRAGRAR